MFKAHVQVGGYDPNDPLLDRAWGAIAEAQTPVVIHCGSGPQPGRHTGPEPIAALMTRHPRLRLIVAHMGMPEYRDFLDLCDRYREMRLDTAMAFTSFFEETTPFPRSEHGGCGTSATESCSAATSPTSPTATSKPSAC